MQFPYFDIAVKLLLVACLFSPVFCKSANEKNISKSEFDERNIIVLAYDSQDCQRACLGVGTCQFEDYGYLSDSDREYLLNAAVSPYCSQHHWPRCDEELLANKPGTYLTPNDAHCKQTKYAHPYLTISNCCVSGHWRLSDDPLPACGASEPQTRRLCTCRKGNSSSSATKLAETSSASTSTAKVSTSSSTAAATENKRNKIVILAVCLTIFAVTLIFIVAYLLWRRHSKHRISQKKSVAYLDIRPRSKGDAPSVQSTVSRKAFLTSDSRTRRDKTTKTKSNNSSSRKRFPRSKTSRIVYSRNPKSSSDTAYEIVN